MPAEQPVPKFIELPPTTAAGPVTAGRALEFIKQSEEAQIISLMTSVKHVVLLSHLLALSSDAYIDPEIREWLKAGLESALSCWKEAPG